MLIGLDTGGGGGEGEERESHSKVGTLLGPTIMGGRTDIILLKITIKNYQDKDKSKQNKTIG